MTPSLHQTPRHLESMRKFRYARELLTLPCYEIVVDGKAMRFSAAEDSTLIFGRVATLFAKEPTTIPYLESFDSRDVLFDIGANIGLYTVYASVMTGCQVIAIEPEALNYAELNKNIYLNHLNGRVTAYCAAAADGVGVGKLLLGAFATGYSHHDFGENSWRKDMQWTKDVTVARDQRITQGSISVSIDRLIEQDGIPFPNHIKIDVDGHERKVIDGARKTLRDPRLKTVLVEIDFGIDTDQEIIEIMTANGWKYSMNQLITNRSMIMRPERVGQLREIKKDGFNYIFYKDDKYGAMFDAFLAAYVPPYTKQGQFTNMPRLIDEMH